MAVSTPRGVTQRELLALLADGSLHSGERLAAELGVSRAAVWKGIERLRDLGIDVQAQSRRGYALARPVELLDARLLRNELNAAGVAALRQLELQFEVDSTNTLLLAAAPPPPGRADAVLSELQHAGRGRRGCPWIAPFGGGIALSLAWCFQETVRELPSLSLAVGVAISRALVRAGARGIRLKWPNDLWFEDRKLGGVLIELRAEAGGAAHVVIGIGINVTLGAAARSAIEATGVRAACVADACAAPPSRNRVAGAILDELLRMLAVFESDGFAPFHAEWAGLDALRDRAARVVLAGGGAAGTARGVDPDGALVLEVGGVPRRYVSGEVSLRLDGLDS
jgi:BirA family biotin operon repressor/biotin-[acetyl-CoA-carboxylase] ligase